MQSDIPLNILTSDVLIPVYGAYENLVVSSVGLKLYNPLALELDIYSLAHNLCKMLIFYEPRRATLGNTRHFVEE